MTCAFTAEQLAAWVAGDASDAESRQIHGHLAECPDCRRITEAIRRTDELLRTVRPMCPPAGIVLDARRALAAELRPSARADVLTLKEAAEVLRISDEDLGQIVDELPVFEIAGRIRIRRQRLFEWIERRERDYTRQRAASHVSRATRIRLAEGVA